MITLYHALKDLADADISEIKFNSIKELRGYIENMCARVTIEKGNYKPSKTVYLFTYTDPIDDESELFVTSRIYMIADLLTQAKFFGFDVLKVFHLQEYESFEAAYEVALSMKESSPLCYDPE